MATEHTEQDLHVGLILGDDDGNRFELVERSETPDGDINHAPGCDGNCDCRMPGYIVEIRYIETPYEADFDGDFKPAKIGDRYFVDNGSILGSLNGNHDNQYEVYVVEDR